MLMNISKLIIWLLGVGIIVFLSVLANGLFEDNRVLFLDVLVLIIDYSLMVFVYGELFLSREKFAAGVPGLGVKFYTYGFYSICAIVFIFLGLILQIPFYWQLFIQVCLLALVVGGLLFSNASDDALGRVANQSQSRHANTDNLALVAQQLQLSASLSHSLDSVVKSEIQKMSERVGYITPSSSSAAHLQEDLLRNSINSLITLVNTNAPVGQVYTELEKAKEILSQRLKTY